MEAIFFYFFGVNWQSYIFHASFINAFLTLFTFLVLKNFKLETKFCFIYALLFSILAYPSSGTPFVDHHSAFLSLCGIYSLLLFVNNKDKKYLILMPIFLILAFLSKQVPAFYLIFFISLILVLYSIRDKTLIYIKYSLITSIIFVFLLILFGKIQGIKFNLFIEQYILYPQTIGSERFSNFNLSFGDILDKFKFIYFVMIPLFIVFFDKKFKKKKYFKKKIKKN